ncbi:CHAT domain-containing protein [Streptomyces sp. NRRL F-5053]|uniref:CHAT domain-containing protein n=1 Tax=Streptomyces sp. NRRL F-5053 TaxID=1463854 RepID=UPI000689933F|nr:CHAT domain-containing protein [Streptomyces sp. NRRL F-5053]
MDEVAPGAGPAVGGRDQRTAELYAALEQLGPDPDGTRALALHGELADLHHEQGTVSRDPADFRASAEHWRALRQAAEDGVPGMDGAVTHYGLGRALMLAGMIGADKDELRAALHALDRAVESVPDGAEPEWLLDARARAACLRGGLSLEDRGAEQAAVAEREIEELLALPDALEQFPPGFLEQFAKLLYECAAGRDDDAGRERALELLRHTVVSRRAERDGPAWRPGLTLATLQQTRYQADRAPARLRDVLLGTGRVLEAAEAADVDRETWHSARLLRLWAEQECASRGVRPEGEGTGPGGGESPGGRDGAADPEEAWKQLRESMAVVQEKFLQGEEFFDFRTSEPGSATISEVVGGSGALLRDGFERTYAEWQAEEPGSARRADGALLLLTQRAFLGGRDGHIPREQIDTLIDSAVSCPHKDDAWRARAHTVAAAALLMEDTSGARLRLDALGHHLRRARELGCSDAELEYLEATAAMLRGQMSGGRDDVDAGVAAARRLSDQGFLSPYHTRVLAAQSAGMAGARAARTGDLAGADRALAELADVLREMKPEDPSRLELWVSLENLVLERDTLARAAGQPAYPLPPGRPDVGELRRGAERLPRGQRAWVLGSAGLTRAGHALLQHDVPAIEAATELLREAMSLVAEDTDDWLRYAGTLGGLLCALSDAATHPRRRAARLTEGTELLERTAERAGGPAHRLWSNIALGLGRAYRARGGPGDRRRARRSGLDALRGHVLSTLLQSGTAHAAEAAGSATAGAFEVAAWCLTDGAPDEAVRALDACRGLVLHAALTSASVPQMLDAAGRTELAARWRDAVAAAGAAGAAGAEDGPDGPDSRLRRQVFEALTADGTGAHVPARRLLLDPPAPRRIGQALRATGADALVYLVPASEDGGGAAVTVTARGRVDAVPLPALREDAEPLRAYGTAAGAVRDLGPVGATGQPHPGTGRGPWEERLDRLCSWAWQAAMGPLLDRLPGPRGGGPARGHGRVAKLVLVPMGALGVVPWHAAWTPDGRGGRRYAVQECEISYAASARLLCEVAGREPVRPDGAALFVGDPTGDLRHAGHEADAIQRRLYPGARYLGRRAARARHGPGTPAEVLDWLRAQRDPGAVLHLACHATVAAGSRHSAHLALHGGALAAEELTEASGGMRDAAGAGIGLVVLAACRSHISVRGSNEAYTLSTAFLTAAARSVIGTLWPVPDDTTSALMYMTHWYLRHEGHSPGRALRAAQLWMLDPHRTPPPGMPPALARHARAGAPADPAAWAGFTHLGQ